MISKLTTPGLPVDRCRGRPLAALPGRCPGGSAVPRACRRPDGFCGGSSGPGRSSPPFVLGGAGWWVHPLRRNRHAPAAGNRSEHHGRCQRYGTPRVDGRTTDQRPTLRRGRTTPTHGAGIAPLGRRKPCRGAAVAAGQAQESLRARLKHRLQLSGYVGYFVVSPEASCWRPIRIRPWARR